MDKAVARWEVLRPLGNRDFLRLWSANGLWWQALWIEILVFGWLALSMTDSAWWVSLIGFFRFGPLLPLGVFGTAITDRFSRRRLVVWLQLSNAIGIGSLSVLLAVGLLEYWHLAVVAALNGSGWALDWPTRRALIPDLVGRERVVDAMLLENFVQSLSRMSGPLGGGSLLAVIGTQATLMLLAVAGLVAAIILYTLKTESRAPSAATGVADALVRMREGIRYVFRTQNVLAVVLVTATLNLWAFPFNFLLPVFARDVLGQGPVGFGMLGTCQGMGAMLGLLMVNRVRRFLSLNWLFALGSLLVTCGIGLFSLSATMVLSMAAMFGAGFGQVFFSTMQSALILRTVSDEMRGRVMSTLVLAIGGGPLGSLQAGLLAGLFGAPLAVTIMSALATAAVITIARFVPGFVRKPRDG